MAIESVYVQVKDKACSGTLCIDLERGRGAVLVYCFHTN